MRWQPAAPPAAEGINAEGLRRGIDWLHSRYPIMCSVLIARRSLDAARGRGAGQPSDRISEA
jgi:hypothetical protein